MNPPSLRSLVLLVALGSVPVAGVTAADDVADERESPALRAPLPVLAPPVEERGAPPDFAKEAPPPPPLDPDYRAPNPSSSPEGTSP